jgi:hypothetical protein
MKNPIRRLFPRRPMLGIVLCVALLLEGAAVAEHLIKANASGNEGKLELTGIGPIGQNGYRKCGYTRSDDYVSDWVPYPGFTKHPDAWGQDEPGHHSYGYVYRQGYCEQTPPPLVTLTFPDPVDQYHRYGLRSSGVHH